MLSKLLNILNRNKVNKKEYDNLSEQVLVGSDLPTLDSLKSLFRSSVWKYMSDTMAFRIKSARDDLEDQNLDIETIRVHQGRIEELRFIDSLPSFIIENYENLRSELDAKKEANKKE